ncbi:MAG: PDZ domain-containing protein [Planctomycetota bacterium]
MAIAAFAREVRAQRDESPPAFKLPSAQEAADTIRDMLDLIRVPRARLARGPHVREAFRSIVDEFRDATVEVRSGGKRVAMGGVVGPNGWIVTKASRCTPPVVCVLRDGRKLPAELIGVDPEIDVAMLKVEATGLPSLELGKATSAPDPKALLVALKTSGSAPTDGAIAPADELVLAPGDWLATVGRGRDPIAVGVVSVLPRKIAKRPGFLGITMANEVPPSRDGSPRPADSPEDAVPGGAKPDEAPAAEGVTVTDVTNGGAAAEAGIQPGDVITSVGGAPTPDREALAKAVRARNPGDRVSVTVWRGGESRRVVALLRGWDSVPRFQNAAQRRSLYQNRLGGELSRRRFGFPEALQHDTILTPEDCGGPVVDLRGQVVGFNIARAGRTESYLLPASLVRSRMVDLMSGKLAPPTAD